MPWRTGFWFWRMGRNHKPASGFFFFPPVILQNVIKLGEVSKQGKLFKLRLHLSLKAVYKCSEEVSWDKALKFWGAVQTACCSTHCPWQDKSSGVRASLEDTILGFPSFFPTPQRGRPGEDVSEQKGSYSSSQRLYKSWCLKATIRKI